MFAHVYKFPHTTSKRVIFEKLFRHSEPATKNNLTNASAARDSMLLAITSSPNIEDAILPIERYIPIAMSLVQAVESNTNLKLNDSLNFTWSSVISERQLPAMYTCNSIRYELSMALLTLGFMHCNQAAVIMKKSTDVDFEEKSKLAAQELRIAAGVFEYLYSTELPKWMSIPNERPPEVLSQVANGLANMCVAQAQQMAIKKAVLKESSAGVISKLCIEVYRRYDNCLNGLKASPKDFPEISNTLKAYVMLNQALWRGIALQYLAQEAYGNEQYGKAVSYLNLAEKQMKEIVIPPKSPLEVVKDDVHVETEKVIQMKIKYTKDNDMVYFNKLVEFNQLEIPDGKCIVGPIPYTPPDLLFMEIK